MATSTASQVGQHNQDEYEAFLDGIQKQFAKTVFVCRKALFTTNATGLFDVFLGALPENIRQHYTCNACKKFVDMFGGIVAIDPVGETIPAMWPTAAPHIYRNSVNEVRAIVAKAKVTGVFLSRENPWGKPVTGEWQHMAVVPDGVTFNNPLQTPSQAMAEKREDYKSLLNGLRQFPLDAVKQALRVLETDTLYRSEKVIGVARWLCDVHEQRNLIKNKRIQTNLTWLAVAKAPAGFCHIKSSMIGTLLEDIVTGRSFGSVSRRFYDKMHPLQYQRPQVAPTVGNIAQAEKVIKKFDAAGALDRRFARIDEVKLIWKPTDQFESPIETGGGVFGHLKPKGAYEIREMNIPPITMTWSKFKETVLQSAEAIEFYISPSRDSYTALVTAVNYNAPPILQWDSERQRNPVSWYLYHNGSHPGDWGLTSGVYHPVTGICFKPSMWYGNFSHYGQGVVFILDGAKDGRYETSGNSLFPETLKREFREIRATIEAYSRSAVLQGYDEASACGIALSSGDSWSASFRVLSDGQKTHYKLDRWD
ncbi:MAG: hypothetical protein ACYTFW_03655 [Planctomycetota bacterium]|jgi:hypothetical protein